MQARDLVALRDEAAKLLTVFIDPTRAAEQISLTTELRPRDEDYEKVFVETSLQTARAVYDKLWLNIPPIGAKPGQSVVLAWICLSEQLGSRLGRRFPGGYQKIVDRLVPDVPWLCWKFVELGKMHGMAYDGLVHVNDRWVWFPKPWKLLLPAESALLHWFD